MLDLIYLRPGGDERAYLQELRLQNLDGLNLAELRRLADRAASPKLRRAVDQVAALAHTETSEYETL